MLKVLSLGLIATALSAVSVINTNPNNKEKEVRDAQIIVKLNYDKTNDVDALLRSQNNFLKQVDSLVTTNYSVGSRYTNLMNGLTLKVPSKYVSEIRKLDMVNRIDYDKKISAYYHESDLSEEVVKQVNEELENVSAKTMNKPEGTNNGAGITVAVLDTGYMINATFEDEEGVVHKNATHEVYTDLTKGTKIKETKDTIQKKIDSSKTFHGKAKSGETTYLNNKVPFFYDYGGQSDTYGVPGEGDCDVYNPLEAHGQHTSSLIGGNAPSFKGIASDCQLICMKVATEFYPTIGSQYSTASLLYTSNIINALEDCATLGVDIINMSLGSNLNDLDENSIPYQIINKLEEKGTKVCVSAGNNGKNNFTGSAYENWTTDMTEMGTLGNFSNNTLCTAIASGQPDKMFFENALIVGNKTVAYADQVVNYTSSSGEVIFNPERYLSDLLNGSTTTEFTWTRIPGFGEATDFDKTRDAGKIAIINRGGEVPFTTKVVNAENAGCVAACIINNDPSETSFNSRMDFGGYSPKIPVAYILYRDRNTFDNATTTKCRIIENKMVENPTARMMSDFSSDGATYDLRIKPEISSPGEMILGSVNGSTDSYAYMSGTSMAAPNFAGALAVLLSQNVFDKDLRDSSIARMMSTANPMKDRYEVNFASVRQQGAGLADIKGAINSKVYLDGTTTDKLSGKAKIELKNNDDIKNGDLKLSFSTISSLDKDVTYTATTYIYRPELVTLDEEYYPEFKGTKFQATYNHLIDKVSQSITVKPGQNVVNLNKYSLTETVKNELKENFENGNYIEGYVVLTAEGQEDLSIPYLGFFGDYNSQAPVEEFAFEKDPNKVYPSDIINSVANKWGGKPETYYGSDIVTGYFKNIYDIDITDMLLNESNIRSLTDDNVKTVRPVTNDYFSLGNNGKNNTMIIQQYVTRSVATNTITIKNKANDNVVLTDHMYDVLYGADEDSNGVETAWPLRKSHVDLDYWNSSQFILADRAYTMIPMYRLDESGNKVLAYPDGEYEMVMSYTLVNGKEYTKKVNFNICSSSPVISDVEETTEESGTTYEKVRLTNGDITTAYVDGKVYTVLEDEEGSYILINKDDITDGKFYIKSTNSAEGSSSSITHLNDPNGVLSLSNDKFTPVTDFVSLLEKIDENNLKLSFTYTKSGQETIITSGELQVCMTLPEGFNKNNLKVYQSNTSRVNVTFLSENKVLFTGLTPRAVFTLCNDPDIPTTYKSRILTASLTDNIFYVGETLSFDSLLVSVKNEAGVETLLKPGEYQIDTSYIDTTKADTYILVIKYGNLSATCQVVICNKDSEPVEPTIDDTKVIPDQLYNAGETGNTGGGLSSGAIAAIVASSVIVVTGAVVLYFVRKNKIAKAKKDDK